MCVELLNNKFARIFGGGFAFFARNKKQARRKLRTTKIFKNT
jgi:hypothetical protein